MNLVGGLPIPGERKLQRACVIFCAGNTADDIEYKSVVRNPSVSDEYLLTSLKRPRTALLAAEFVGCSLNDSPVCPNISVEAGWGQNKIARLQNGILPRETAHFLA